MGPSLVDGVWRVGAGFRTHRAINLRTLARLDPKAPAGLVAALLALTLTPAAQAAYTGTVNLGQKRAALVGSGPVVTTTGGGVFHHGAIGAGFASDRDFDSVKPGEQAVPDGGGWQLDVTGEGTTRSSCARVSRPTRWRSGSATPSSRAACRAWSGTPTTATARSRSQSTPTTRRGSATPAASTASPCGAARTRTSSACSTPRPGSRS